MDLFDCKQLPQGIFSVREMLTVQFKLNGAFDSMAIKAVIFDLDGTLANFNLDYKTLRGDIRSYLIRVGVPASVLSVKENIFEMLKKTEIFFKNSEKTAAFSEVRSEVYAIAEKYELDAASKTSLMSGVIETLKLLDKMKIKIALCTINSEKAANQILQRFKIADFFKIVVSREKVQNYKPNPEHLECAIKVLGTKPKETVIVGDSVVDMQSAKEIKAIGVGIPTGVSTAEQLTSNGANYIITSITDLPVLIGNLNKFMRQ